MGLAFSGRIYLAGYVIANGLAATLIIFNLKLLAQGPSLAAVSSVGTILIWSTVLILLNTTYRSLFSYEYQRPSAVRLKIGAEQQPEQQFAKAANY